MRATRHHQRQNVDRFLIKRTDGRVIHRADYKVDERAADTGNLAFEDISVERDNRVMAKGWIHTTISDLVIFYVPPRDEAYVFEVAVLRRIWDDLLRLFPVKPTGTQSTRPYRTWNCCVPIAWLRQNKVWKYHLLAVGSQLRLPLTATRP